MRVPHGAPSLASSLIAVLLATGAWAGERHDWPQWRGPNRDAVSLESGLASEWTDGGPPVVWRRKVGAGFSGIAVADDKLYTLWDENEIQYLVCLDARTGEEHWRHALGAAFVHHYGDGPRSTPLVDEGLVFAVGTQGRMVAVDAVTGEQRWHHNLVKEHRSTLPTYGYSSSPLALGDKVFIEAGGPGAAFIAFAKHNGEVAWTSHEDIPAYSSPIGVSIGGVEQVVFWSASGLHALDVADGSLLWEHSWETFCPVSGDPLNTATPIFIPPDRLFLSSGSGAAVIAISRSKDGFQVRRVWNSDEMHNDVNTSVLYGGHIYGFDRSILKCLDAGNGEVKWMTRGFGKGSLIATAEGLIVLSERGEVALVEANPDAFVQRAAVPVLNGRSWTAPALAGGKLYLRNHEALVCLDLTADGDGGTDRSAGSVSP